MTTKITYLEADPLLDYWVAMAAGYGRSTKPVAPSSRACASASAMLRANWCRYRCARFGRRPAGATVARSSSASTSTWSATSAAGWRGHAKRDDYSRAEVSPLVAAMRAYLAWEYGDEVPALAE